MLARPVTFWLLLCLLGVDIAAILTDMAVSIAPELTGTEPAWYGPLRLDTEYGLWAVYGYLQLLCVAILLGIAGYLSGEAALAFIAGAFLVTALDDMLMLHERVGVALSGIGNADPATTALTQGVGELAFLALLGSLVLGLALMAIIRAAPHRRPAILLLVAALIFIGFCSVILNFAESAASGRSRLLTKMLYLLDDGGELLASSVALAASLAILDSGARLAPATKAPVRLQRLN